MFSKTAPGLSLFKSKVRHYGSGSAQVQFMTDIEGQRTAVEWFKNSSTVQWDPYKGLDFCNTVKTPYFIFGGDLFDRGNFDLDWAQKLLDFKQRYPEQVFLIAGNRDITKNRFKIELDSKLIRTRLLNSQVPRWLLHNPTVPLDYVNTAMQAQNYFGSVHDFVNSLSIEECQLIYLKWMLEKTMGCPHSFRYRKEELEKSYSGEVTDSMVLQSIIKESSPEGVVGQYLQQTQVGVIIPNTGVLAVHGGLQPNNIGRLPGMGINDAPIGDVKSWIAQFNGWYSRQIQEWVDYRPEVLTEPAFTRLDECVLPIPDNIKSIITADMLGPNRRYVGAPAAVSHYLRESNIQVVLTGHQPCGDFPVILRSEDKDNDVPVFINGDTSYADVQTADNTRGAATNTLEIFVEGHVHKVDVKATLSDNSQMRTQAIINGTLIVNDPYIGRVTSDNRLVLGKLANGSYRLVSQNGFEVEYSTALPLEVMRLFEAEDHAITNFRA